MSDSAVARSLDSYLQSSRPGLRAQGHYLQSGQVPEGYTVLPNGQVHRSADMRTFLDKYGWLLMASLPLGGLALGAALPAAGGSAAVPDIGVTSGWTGSGVTGGLPSTSFAGAATAPVAGAGNLAGGVGAAAKGAGMFGGFGVKDAVQLAPLIASLFSKGKVSDTPPQNDLMNQLIQMQLSQVQQSQPLRDAVLKMAMGLMPIAYQNNVAVPGAAPQPPPMAMPRR
jgi:hypothetical protein